MLDQPRGWGIVELVWAYLLEENLREAGGDLQTIVLPLFFLRQDEERVLRSVWQSIRDRAAFHSPQDGDPVAWAVRQISSFLQREAERGLDLAAGLEPDSREYARLKERPGLIERIANLHPTPAPIP